MRCAVIVLAIAVAPSIATAQSPRPPDAGVEATRACAPDAGDCAPREASAPDASAETPCSPDAERSARECTMRGDNACVIRQLASCARSEPAMAMLIEAYRARGQTARALRLMRSYRERFPGTRPRRPSDFRGPGDFWHRRPPPWRRDRTR